MRAVAAAEVAGTLSARGMVQKKETGGLDARLFFFLKDLLYLAVTVMVPSMLVWIAQWYG